MTLHIDRATRRTVEKVQTSSHMALPPSVHRHTRHAPSTALHGVVVVSPVPAPQCGEAVTVGAVGLEEDASLGVPDHETTYWVPQRDE